jgi:hypothetical protein
MGLASGVEDSISGGEQWKDVHASDTYGIAADHFNRVNFDLVTTQQLRGRESLNKNRPVSIVVLYAPH